MTKNEVIYPSAVLRAAKLSAALMLITVVVYFYLQELNKNPIDFRVLKASVNPYCLAFALFLCILSFLVEAVIWKLIINNQYEGKKIATPELFAILFSSGLFRYLPGRIWAIMARYVWLKKYGVTKSLILYVNLIFVIGSIIFSLYLGLLYLAIYSKSVSMSIIIILFLSLTLVNILYTCYNKQLINKMFVLLNKITRIEVQPVNMSLNSMVVIQCIIALSWGLTGLEAYFLARGLGLQIFLMDTIPLTASMSLAWVAGAISVVAPAGLGVREGVMLLMLKPVLAAQTALLLPIVSRLSLSLSEALLGLMALYLGAKRNVFILKKNAARQ